MKKLYIFGAGGFARETLNIVDAINCIHPEFEFMGFVVDDEYYTPNTYLNGFPLLRISEIQFPAAIQIAIGDGSVRARIVSKLKGMGRVDFPTLIHPRAVVGSYNQIDEGSIICAGVVITCNIKIGKFCIINLNSTLGHDAALGSFVTVNPGVAISGNVYLDNTVFVGVGANILEKIRVGENSVIGGGALVHRDVPANVTVVGVPYKIIKQG